MCCTEVEGPRPADIPEAAGREAENTIIDAIVLSVAARETVYGRAVRKACDQRGDCTVFGLAEGVESAAAAVINGTCGHGEDYDNPYEGCPVHSGVVIVHTLFAAAHVMTLPHRDVATDEVVDITCSCCLTPLSRQALHRCGCTTHCTFCSL